MHHSLGNSSQAITYLKKALHIADGLDLRHRSNSIIWNPITQNDTFQVEIEKASHLLDDIKRENKNSDYKICHFDLQTANSFEQRQINEVIHVIIYSLNYNVYFKM